MKKSSKKFSINPANYIYMLAGIVFFTGVALLGWFSWHRLFPGATEPVVTNAEEVAGQAGTTCAARAKLNGVCVLEPGETDPQLYVAVMIENHVDARPQAGLSKASIVYEAPVEANITRFMALYDPRAEVAKVGPVRSARPYYLDWAAEYVNPMYMHVGGSPDAMDKIETHGMFNLDEFYRGWYFWRSDDRYAPHNTYTSNVLWNKAIEAYAKNPSTEGFEPWTFGAGEKDARSASTITVSFAPPAYEAVWAYATSTGRYARYQMGRPHVDDDGTPITASTIIVQRVKVKVLDAVGRRAIDTVGSGEATVFKNGHVIAGTWKKESRTGRTKWYTHDGTEIALAPGNIWIEVLGQDGSLAFE